MALGCLASSVKSLSSALESSPTNFQKLYDARKVPLEPCKVQEEQEDLPSSQAKVPLSGNDTFRANYPLGKGNNPEKAEVNKLENSCMGKCPLLFTDKPYRKYWKGITFGTNWVTLSWAVREGKVLCKYCVLCQAPWDHSV